MDNLLVSSLKYFFEEHKNNSELIVEIAKKNMHQQTLRTSLGVGWIIIRDIVFFAVFVMFRFLMSGSKQVEGVHYILFLMVAMVPWNFINECINGGVSAIKKNKPVLKSMMFPIVIMSTIEILAIFLKRMFTFVILFIIIFIWGDIRDVSFIMLLYYFFTMFIFMVLWNQIFSAFVALSNDFEHFYKAVAGVIFYTMPIIWSFEVIENIPWAVQIFKINPLIYIIQGFRDACYTGNLPNIGYTIYFWSISLVLLVIGTILQYKLRRHYVDLI